MRWIRATLALLVVALGLAFGALNDSDLQVNLYLVEFSMAAGSALLGAALAGALLAGLSLWLTVIWPLQVRLRRAQRAEQQAVGSALMPVEQDPVAQDRA